MAFAGVRPTFAGPGDDLTINDSAITDLTAYLECFPQGNSEAVFVDASVTSLYYHETAVPNIVRYGASSPKFVAVLRDPVDRAFSNFQYQRSRGLEPLESLRDALEVESDRRSDNWQHMFHYRALGDYAAGLTAFSDEFGTDSLRVLFYEDLETNALETLNGVARHFGVPEFERLPLPERVNSSGSPRLPLVAQSYSWIRSHPQLQRRLRSAVPVRYRSVLRRVGLRRDDLDPTLRADLRAEWADLYDGIEEALGSVPPSW